MNSEIRKTLEAVKNGKLSVDDALLAIKKEPFEDIGYAKVDLHRGIRQGAAEVIYGAGKTPEQMVGIIGAMLEHEVKTILITRLSEEKAEKIQKTYPQMDYRKDAKIGTIGQFPAADGLGKIVVATAGTSDIPVAEEAALTAEFFGSRVDRIFDVGVAGIHRLLARTEEIRKANCVVAVAGMEGALGSVMAGLVENPVIAVPTSVGYGASFGGVSALLTMLNSCAEGMATVNIDNGFGAGYMANQINHLAVGAGKKEA